MILEFTPINSGCCCCCNCCMAEPAIPVVILPPAIGCWIWVDDVTDGNWHCCDIDCSSNDCCGVEVGCSCEFCKILLTGKETVVVTKSDVIDWIDGITVTDTVVDIGDIIAVVTIAAGGVGVDVEVVAIDVSNWFVTDVTEITLLYCVAAVVEVAVNADSAVVNAETLVKFAWLVDVIVDGSSVLNVVTVDWSVFGCSVVSIGEGTGDGEVGGNSLGDSGNCWESSSMDTDPPCAWFWWYFKPFTCLYFLLQSCSGHSNKIGEIAHGAIIFTFFAGICTFNPVTGFIKFCVLQSPFSPLIGGEGLSSLDLRFSPLGGGKLVGDVDGVVQVGLLAALFGEFDDEDNSATTDDEDDEDDNDDDDDDTDEDNKDDDIDVVIVDVVVVGVVYDIVVAVVEMVVDVGDVVEFVRLARPLAPPFRNLLWTYNI